MRLGGRDFQIRFFVGGFYLIGNLGNCNVWDIMTMLCTQDSTNVRSSECSECIYVTYLISEMMQMLAKIKTKT